MCCVGLALLTVNQIKPHEENCHGLTMMWHMKRFESPSALMSRTHLKAMITHSPVRKIQELDSNLVNMESHETVRGHRGTSDG